MAMDPKTLIYTIEKAVGINDVLQKQDQKILALTDPIKYNRQFTDKLSAVKKAGEDYVTSQLQNYASSGLNQDQINQLVGQEAVSRYQSEMTALNTLFPYCDQAERQIRKNKAPRVTLDAIMSDAPKRKRAAAVPKAPKRKAAAPRKKAAAPKRKTATKKRK